MSKMVLCCLPASLRELIRLFDLFRPRASCSAMNSSRVRLRKVVDLPASRDGTTVGDGSEAAQPDDEQSLVVPSLIVRDRELDEYRGEVDGLRIVLIIQGRRSGGKRPVDLWREALVSDVGPGTLRTDGIDGT